MKVNQVITEFAPGAGGFGPAATAAIQQAKSPSAVAYADTQDKNNAAKALKIQQQVATGQDPTLTSAGNAARNAGNTTVEDEQGMAEGKMAELEIDIEDPEITDQQFEKMYGMSRQQAQDTFTGTNVWEFPDVRDPTRPLHEKDVAEGKPKEKEADYGADYQAMVARVKKLAGLGPLRTVYDPQKRVYRNVPTAVQPKK